MPATQVETNGHANGDVKALVTKGASNPKANISAFRRLVPLVQDEGRAFLNAAFNPPSNLIVNDAISKYLAEALYEECPKQEKWQAATEATRKLLGRYINADPSNIAFTRDTTEGLNCFIRGLRFQPGDNVVLLDSEHPNHAFAWMAMREAGLEVRQVPTIPEAEKTGKVTAANAATFAPYVDDRTRAIGLSSVMFHSGQWNDVADICKAFRPRGIHVLVDASQQVGFAPIDVTAWGVSAVSFSTHKGLNCPTGLAALYVDSAIIAETNPTPPVVGAGAVSKVRADLLVSPDAFTYHPTARRYDHLNVSLIAVAAAKAQLEFYLDILGPAEVEAHLYNLGDALREECKELNIPVIGPEGHEGHAPHLYIIDLHDPRWPEHFKENRVIVTPYRLGVRVSFGFYNNVGDVKKLAKVLKSGLDKSLPIGRV